MQIVESYKDYFLGLPEPNKHPDLILVNSPLTDHSSVLPTEAQVEMLPAVGLGYIATECKAAGYDVGVIDPETAYFSPETTAKVINDANPRWVGINLLTPTYALARRIVANLRPEISVMAGGAHAKALPEKTLRDPFFSRRIKVLALEDGEFIAKGLLSGEPRENMEGVAYINQEGEFVNKPFDRNRCWIPQSLDLLHTLDRSFLPRDPFYSEGRFEVNISASRGCSFNCGFCAGARESSIFGTRFRSVDNVIDELMELRDRDVSAVRFIDDLFLAGQKRIREFSEAMQQTGLAKDLVWDATGRANILARMDRSTLETMALSGCREIAIGVESGSARMLAMANKHIDPEMIKKSVFNLAAVGIRVKGYFIVGFPSETRAEIAQTTGLMKDLRCVAREAVNKNFLTPLGNRNTSQFRASVFEFRPFPGTAFYRCITGKKPWPEEVYQHGYKPDIYSDDDILGSFGPVHIKDQATRQRHNYGINAPFADGVLPYEIQDMIAEAMRNQEKEMVKNGEYLPGLNEQVLASNKLLVHV